MFGAKEHKYDVDYEGNGCAIFLSLVLVDKTKFVLIVLEVAKRGRKDLSWPL